MKSFKVLLLGMLVVVAVQAQEAHVAYGGVALAPGSSGALSEPFEQLDSELTAFLESRHTVVRIVPPELDWSVSSLPPGLERPAAELLLQVSVEGRDDTVLVQSRVFDVESGELRHVFRRSAPVAEAQRLASSVLEQLTRFTPSL